ncbi:MAG: hypothetical protein J4G14_10400 [Dehalococcoidia bacterium]|nr:hypothetical protein [Dehalococcoidia bacterium]
MQDFNNSPRNQDHWRTDESDLVNTLAGAMVQHHVNRRARIRNFLRRLVGRPSR